jgi:signal peptidase II
MTRLATALPIVILVVTTIGCDHVTKHYAASVLAGAPDQSFLGDTIRLQYAENTGAFLSIGANLPPVMRTAIFTYGNALLLIALLVAAARLRWHGARLLGLVLFVAGGASNLIDRAAYGTVVDFINVGVGALRTGIFNVADVAIMLGAGILLLSERRPRHAVVPPMPGEDAIGRRDRTARSLTPASDRPPNSGPESGTDR